MGNDLTDLKAAVDEFEGHGLYETDGGYSKASRKLEYLELVKGTRDIVLYVLILDLSKSSAANPRIETKFKML